MDFLKTELLCFKGHYQESEDTIYRMEENISSILIISNKGLVSRICKEILQLTT